MAAINHCKSYTLQLNDFRTDGAGTACIAHTAMTATRAEPTHSQPVGHARPVCAKCRLLNAGHVALSWLSPGPSTTTFLSVKEKEAAALIYCFFFTFIPAYSGKKEHIEGSPKHLLYRNIYTKMERKLKTNKQTKTLRRNSVGRWKFCTVI